MSTRFAYKTCEHCGDHLSMRRGSWDSWSTVADMFLPHACEGAKAEHKAAMDANFGAAFAELWTATIDAAADRYDG